VIPDNKDTPTVGFLPKQKTNGKGIVFIGNHLGEDQKMIDP
jgi:hypothetical protein